MGSRDRVKKNSRRAEAKRKLWGRNERHYFWEEKASDSLNVPRQCPFVLLIRIE
jgi:hypothetical protein